MNTELKNRATMILLDYLGVLKSDRKELENRDNSEFNDQLKVYNQEDINKVEQLLKDLKEWEYLKNCI